MTTGGLAVFALASLMLLVLLKRYSGAFSVLAEVGVVIILFISILPDFKELLDALSEINNIAENSSDILKTMLKAFAILTAGGVVADICRDNGENALAGVLESVVKVLAILCAMPTFTAVLKLALTLLEQ